ncbi:M4 family metallopeptidase [Actinokineospora sp. NBRC 105648]|uniref:M4 family metallopeptidase n=1 Tax=Actinokineospora sp. NBRC 105648 TaxID=3032206 RepID=UPI0024A24B6B|nr:M4 family metallopeptidase [Actinokineospora sp. NBRC 105648]GLZ39346.1 zinc metalloprotease [Actinokineospora sp. NBRC 105648]
MKSTHRLLAVGGAVVTGLVVIGTAVAAPNATQAPTASAAQAQGNAVQAATALVNSRPAALHASADDAFVQRNVYSYAGSQYVSYDRTYKGLPVIGGDFVVATNAAGAVQYTSVAQDQAIQGVGTTAKITQAQAEGTAKGKLKAVTEVEGSRLVVVSLGTPTLAWETTVKGTSTDGEYSRLSVYTDATSGKVVRTQEHVAHGSGNSAYNGPVTIDTTHSGSTYTLRDPNTTNLSCQDLSTGTVFSKSSDSWGNGSATSKETGCVDALFAAQTEKKMLSQWLGRNGMDGNGGAWPIKVGLDDLNAFYDGSQVQIGHNQSNGWISSMDVVGHEMGHGIDDHTPGGISNGGTQEFVADTFGAATEAFANEASQYDPPDYLVGEEINLVGNGPIRNMYNPSLVNNNANCYSSSVPGGEVHAAAGPGNHWFYLLAEGNAPAGKPASPTCNNSSLTGLGIQSAIKIMYNAMLLKTSSSSYLKYRTWTLQAAKTLYPGSCVEFNKVKAAWDAVSVPAQSADPTCTGGTTTTPPSSTTTTPPTTTTAPPGGCSGQKILNPGFESGAASWTQTSGVIGQFGTQEPAHGGTYDAWLNGYGSTHTDSVAQSVTIPAGCRATLTYYLHIDTAETGSTVYDKLTVTAGSTTLASYSNVNKAAGYVQKSVDVSSLAGSTFTLKFNGTEDASLQTSFVLDDLALTLG